MEEPSVNPGITQTSNNDPRTANPTWRRSKLRKGRISIEFFYVPQMLLSSFSILMWASNLSMFDGQERDKLMLTARRLEQLMLLHFSVSTDA
jgi:hypothetical protein